MTAHVRAVELEPRVRARILEHAFVAHPEEACGILVGLIEADRVRLRQALRCPNHAPRTARTRRFEIDPCAVLNVQRELRSTAHEIVGFYHSHPESAPQPSPADLEYIRLWPNTVWLIAGLDASGQTSLRTWWLDANPATSVRELRIASPSRAHAAGCPA